MSINKTIRFEVFKRDAFKCQYCGKFPPEITLEIDHINPKSKGGKDIINNLVTSCFDCNRGKSNIELSKIPNTLQDNYDILIEREIQLKQYNKLISKIEKRINKETDEINKIFSESFKNRELTENFKNISIRNFIKKLGLEETKDAMRIACARNLPAERTPSYFCGICWNKINQQKELDASH